MPRADGRVFRVKNSCSCGRRIGPYAERCKSCNLRHQYATGARRPPTPDSLATVHAAWRGRKHSTDARAKISAAIRAKQTPEFIAHRVAADPRNFRLDKTTLRHLYVAEALSCAAIARRLRCNRDTVRRAMDRFGVRRRSKAEESRLRFAENLGLRERLREGARRFNRQRWDDPTCRAAMQVAITKSWTPERRRALGDRNREWFRRNEAEQRERLRNMSRRPNKPWAAQTMARLREDPAFELRRRTSQLASVREGWLTGRLGPKGKVDYRRPDGTSVRLGSWAEAIVAFWLDKLEVPWEQPKRGLRLPGARVYRPDFWLPNVQRYLEVKGGKSWEVRERAVHRDREPNIRLATVRGARGPAGDQVFWPQSLPGPEAGVAPSPNLGWSPCGARSHRFTRPPSARGSSFAKGLRTLKATRQTRETAMYAFN
jgi:hypothetical protein